MCIQTHESTKDISHWNHDITLMNKIVLKEDMNKSLKEIYENTNKQKKEMNKTAKDLKVEIEQIRKIQTKENLVMKNFAT